MCAGALVLARVSPLVYGADDPKAGACASLYRIPSDPRLNHSIETASGVLAEECAGLLREFFRARRCPPAVMQGRRGARAVEWAGLENRCPGNRTEGSNPSLSAT